LKRLEPQEANETLGIYLAMDRNQLEEVKSLREKTSAFAKKIRTGMIQKDEAWQALHTTIMKTLEYPMPAINLSKQQWEYVMAPLLWSVLPGSGIVRTFPRNLLYAPCTLTGMGIMHPFYKQQLKHLDLFLQETLQPAIASNLLHAILKQHWVEISLPCSNGKWQFKIFGPCFTHSWLADLLQFCKSKSIFIVVKCSTLSLLTSNDRFLMQCFADIGYRGDDLQSLNQCQLFLKCVTLSDICSADGVSITFDAYNGKTLTRTCSMEWPRQQPSLPRPSWQLWQRALDRCFL
jgi:hypothetical protein